MPQSKSSIIRRNYSLEIVISMSRLKVDGHYIKVLLPKHERYFSP